MAVARGGQGVVLDNRGGLGACRAVHQPRPAGRAPEQQHALAGAAGVVGCLGTDVTICTLLGLLANARQLEGARMGN